MVRITMDHSAMIFYHRHPGIQKLREMEEKDEVNIYNAITLDRQIETLSEIERKMHDRLKSMVFGDRNITLTEHGDLVLLVNHIKSRRDFFLTLEKDKYRDLEKHRDLKIRFPDEKFLKEVRAIVKQKGKKKKAN